MAKGSQDTQKKMLERGYWIATHRLTIQKYVSIGLYVVIGFLYAIFFVQFGIYMFRFNQWNDSVASSVVPSYNWETIHANNTPLGLAISKPNVFSLGDQKYDIVVEAFNPNEEWAVRNVSYTFLGPSGEEYGTVTESILPRERKFFALLGITSRTPIVQAQYQESEYEWQRVEELPPISWIYNKEPTFVPRQVVITNGQQSLIPARVQWDVTNGSTLNISNVTWQIGFYSGDTLVSVQEYESERIQFYEDRSFDIIINSQLPRVSNVVVYPVVDIFSPNFTFEPDLDKE